ncbi:TIGR01440 family protein [Evansella sp. AB-rgal1]|uniref:TIGR01440 family protein n=1 Tax=Evansella sp. AB-rgal1 TaxID=3242696 RepID=UPI00359D2CD1
MTQDTSSIAEELTQALEDLQSAANLESGQLLVIGTSTSEVIGEHIGSAGTREVAESLWKTLSSFQQKTGVFLAFQCCEHLNRALVVEKEYARTHQLEQVSVVPIPGAGGSMAAIAYEKMQAPVMVEEIRADAGIDIGDTLIGMHLKKVAVPVRSKIKYVGEAHITMARTRPKLIGGERAAYSSKQNDQTCH